MFDEYRSCLTKISTATPQLWQRYRWHLNLLVIVLIGMLLVKEVPQSAWSSPIAFMGIHALNISALALSCLVVHATLCAWYSRWMHEHFWLGHIATVLLANGLAVILDYPIWLLSIWWELDLVIFANDQYETTISFFYFISYEYFSDLKYSLFFWAVAETMYIQVQRINLQTEQSSQPLQFASGFLSKIPADYHQAIDIIEAQQNYIKVYANDQQFLILYRFGQATTELGENLGMKTHRSFWVSYSAMTGIQQTGNQCVILTKNGIDVPVSRSFREVVKKLDLPKIDKINVVER